MKLNVGGKKLKTVIAILTALSVVLLPVQAISDPACDAVIDAYKLELSAQKDVTEGERRLKEVYKKQRDEATEKADVTTGMPFYFWVILGAGTYAIVDQVRR